LCGADVVEISSSDDEDNDVRLLASDENEAGEAVDGEADTSGNHVNDALNQRDSSGHVLVNIGHPSDEPDIYLPPQIAAAIKPHQVCWLALLTAPLVDIFATSNSLACCSTLSQFGRFLMMEAVYRDTQPPVGGHCVPRLLVSCHLTPIFI